MMSLSLVCCFAMLSPSMACCFAMLSSSMACCFAMLVSYSATYPPRPRSTSAAALAARLLVRQCCPPPSRRSVAARAAAEVGCGRWRPRHLMDGLEPSSSLSLAFWHGNAVFAVTARECRCELTQNLQKGGKLSRHNSPPFCKFRYNKLVGLAAGVLLTARVHGAAALYL